MKIKLSEADVQLLGASISAANSADVQLLDGSDSSQNLSSPTTISIVTPSSLMQVIKKKA
jgi:hypothetical protein